MVQSEHKNDIKEYKKENIFIVFNMGQIYRF